MTRIRLVIVWSLVLAVCCPHCSRRAEDPPGTVTITFWHSFVASSIPSLDTLIRDFEETHSGTRVKAQYIPTGDGLVQKLMSSLQSGTAPDVSWIHADFLDVLVRSGALVPVSKFMHGPDSLSSDEVSDIFPPLLEAGTYHGVLYALPMEATSLALFYNRGLFVGAGLNPDHPPQTWDELKEYAVRLTARPDEEGRRDQYGFFVPVFPASGELNVWMILQWTPFLWQAGGREYTSDQRRAAFGSEAGVKALTLWKDLYDAEDFGKFGIAHDLGFASGKLAMILDGPWNLPRYRALRGVDWRVAPLPAGPEGRATYLAGEQLAIFRQSIHPAQAWSFVRWIVGTEVQAKFSMQSGYLPVRKSVISMPQYRRFLEQDHALKAFVDQLDHSRGRQLADHHRVELNRILAEAIENCLVGGNDPRRCLQEAAVRADAVLKEPPDY